MSFITDELLPRLENGEVSRQDIHSYMNELKLLKEKYFGLIKVKIDVLGFFSYSSSQGEGFNVLAKVSLVEHPEHYFYINAEKSYDEDSWEQWTVNSKFSSDYKHMQQSYKESIHPINWHYFSCISNLFEQDKGLAGTSFEEDVPECMVDFFHQLPTQSFELSYLIDRGEDIIITSNMTMKEYNDIIDFYK